MMSRATVELDFFGMEKENSEKSPFPKPFEKRRTVRDIQSAFSKINPQLLKNVISSGKASGISDVKLPENEAFRQIGVISAPESPFSVPSTPIGSKNFVPTLPFLNPTCRSSSESPLDTAPLTIFYNGTVSVFDVPRDKAEMIMKLAEKGFSKTVESIDSKFTVSSNDEHQLLENLNGDLPIARRKSLQKFFEKRKERLTSASPYACPSDFMAANKVMA